MIEDRRWRRLRRQVWELQAWRNLSTTPIENWTVIPADGESQPIQIGDRWDEYGDVVRLRAELHTPPAPGAFLDILADGDGLVSLNGRFAGTISPFEREIPLDGARRIEIEISPNDAFGLVGRTAYLKLARLIQPNVEMRQLFRALSLALEFCADLHDSDAVPAVLNAIQGALSLVSLPSDAAIVLQRTRILREELFFGLDEARSLSRHYNYQYPLHAIEHLLTETEHFEQAEIPESSGDEQQPEHVSEALDLFSQRMDEIAKRFPQSGALSATAHAHLDVAWLWPLAETRRKIRHTFANLINLMERYPRFRFTASSAQLFSYVQQDDPALFERVRSLVAEERIEPIGGMWLEPDCNLPSGESLARHLLIGQRYFQREFGYRSSVAWVPDSFGLNGNMPQIFAEAGLRSFVTQKLSWNDTNRFPHDLWRWEGIDGTAIVAHAFNNPIGGYNGQMTPASLELTWRNYRGKSLHSVSLYAFGMGDGGRGPSSEILERAKLLEQFPELPQIKHATVESFFAQLSGDNLPAWVGELYLEFHRGTYTTQSRLKRLNRQAEQRLYEAEVAATLAALHGRPYPRDEFDHNWKTLLLNQFHDILPGSSINEVNVEAERDLNSVVTDATRLRDAAVSDLSNDPAPQEPGAEPVIYVFNPQGFDRALSCVIEDVPADGTVFSATDGSTVHWQRTADGRALLHSPAVVVPGTGSVELRASSGSSAAAVPPVSASDRVLENDHLRVTIADDGSVESLFDKRAEREVFTGPGNDLRMYDDLPAAWEAWNMTDTTYLPGERVTQVELIRVVESGTLRAAIEVRRRYGSSSITQRYQLRADSARLDVVTDIDWHERRKMLRVLFPLNVRSDFATFETSFGAVRRPTHRNTSWDTARFEVPAHRWADLSESGYGVSLLNDGRYGHSVLGSTLGLTLLRSPRDPDPLADLGRHTFTYSIYPHGGNWDEAGTVHEAIDLNSPLIGNVRQGPAAQPGKVSHRWFEIEGLTLAALKLAEEGSDLILRLYDPFGRHGTAHVRPLFNIIRASRTNLLEEEIEPVELGADGTFRLRYHPFQIITLRLTRP